LSVCQADRQVNPPLVSWLPALSRICHWYVSTVSDGFDSVNVKLRVWNIIVGLQHTKHVSEPNTNCRLGMMYLHPCSSVICGVRLAAMHSQHHCAAAAASLAVYA
jgi:hypothetical protein